MKIRKGDTVKVITGKDKGKTGKVRQVDEKSGRVWLEGLNIVKRHQRPTQTHRQGGIIDKEAPISVSNVMYYDEKGGKASRIGYRIDGDNKVRIAKRTGDVISQPK